MRIRNKHLCLETVEIGGSLVTTAKLVTTKTDFLPQVLSLWPSWEPLSGISTRLWDSGHTLEDVRCQFFIRMLSWMMMTSVGFNYFLTNLKSCRLPQLNTFPVCNCLIKFSEFYHRLLYLVCNFSRFENLFNTTHARFLVHIFCHSHFINLCSQVICRNSFYLVIIRACKWAESYIHFYEGQPGDFDLTSSAFAQSAHFFMKRS